MSYKSAAIEETVLALIVTDFFLEAGAAFEESPVSSSEESLVSPSEESPVPPAEESLVLPEDFLLLVPFVVFV